MATTLQIRRGNTDDNDRFKGASGEITLDTDLWQLRAHDNVTVGGHVIAGGGSNTPTIPTINLTNTSGLTYTRSILGNDITFTVGGILSTGYGGTGSASPLMTSTSPLAITGTWPNVNIAISGNVSVDHGGTGLTTTPGQNQVLLGDGSKYNLTTLVPGSGITFDQIQAGILTIRGGGGSGNSITLADLPPGAIQYFAMQAPPDGWLECNGATLSRTAYNNLYQPLWQNIGYQYGGSGDNFNLPDLRGEFIRGWSNGRAGVDASRAFGSTQGDSFQGHHHVSTSSYNYYTANPSGGAGFSPSTGGPTTIEVGNPTTDNTNGTPRTAAETRPRNIALLPCIKYKPGTAQPLLSSVNVSGGTTGLLFSGGPITSTGTITASGTLAVANGGTGTNTAPTNGQLLIGNNGNYNPALLTSGAGITITNSAGAITITNAQAPYTGTNQNETNYPIGHHVLVQYGSSGTPVLNSRPYLYNHNISGLYAYSTTIAGQGSYLISGTWAIRGTFQQPIPSSFDGHGNPLYALQPMVLLQRIL